MTSILHPPETAADAILIAKCLGDEAAAGELSDAYGAERVGQVRENALAWMVRTIDDAVPVRVFHGDRAVVIDMHQPIDATIPPSLKNDLAEPLVTDKVPEAFDAEDTKVILKAVRKATHAESTQLDARDFLSRNAPSRIERVFRKTVLLAMILI